MSESENKYSKEDIEALFESLLKKRETFPRIGYSFVFNAMKSVFFNSITEDLLKTFESNESGIQKIIFLCCYFCKARLGLDVPNEFFEIPGKFIHNDDYSKYGILFTMPEPKMECECNFAGIFVDEGKKVMYTGEYYESDGLCRFCFNYEESRGSTSVVIKTEEDFINAVLGKK